MRQTLSFLSFILFVVAFLPYAWAIWKGKAKPKKSTWIIWASLDSLVFLGMYVAGTLNGQIWGAVLGAGLIAALAFKYGESGWTLTDKICLSGAALGIVLWTISKDPVLGIVTSLFSLFLGAIPTFEGAWKRPQDENKLAWTLFWLSCVAAVLVIPAWTWADAAQPITFLIIESVMMFLLFVRPWLQARKWRWAM